jgi:hypothetical protein
MFILFIYLFIYLCIKFIGFYNDNDMVEIVTIVETRKTDINIIV